jgi:hypothetical protein
MINIQVNAQGALIMLAQMQDQLPYAMSLALNRVAIDGQKAEQDRLKKAFHLRREQFVIRGIKIEKADRASKTTWRVIISIPVAQDFLSKFEGGDPKVPRNGKWLWIPNPAVFANKIINRGNPLHPKQLHFQKSKGGQLQGDQRTFMIKGKHGKPIVLQRVDRKLGKGSASTMRAMTLDNVQVGMGPRQKREKAIHRTGGTRLLYTLVSRVPTPVRLEFVNTITHEVEAQWPGRINEAIHEALGTAR